MLQVRVIPALLLHNAGLVKTVKFRRPNYIGDPINAIKIFNEKAVDKLAILDISATRENRGPSFTVIEEIATECFMPLGYGGGITTVDDIKRVLATGVEKVILNSAALSGPQLVEAAARQVRTGMVSMVRQAGGYEIYGAGGTHATGLNPSEFAKHVQDAGAGEILINSIDRDGTCEGYDLALIGSVAEAVRIPVIACGGAGRLEHFRQAVDAGASAVAAGSMFVYVGKHRAVTLINCKRWN